MILDLKLQLQKVIGCIILYAGTNYRSRIDWFRARKQVLSCAGACRAELEGHHHPRFDAGTSTRSTRDMFMQPVIKQGRLVRVRPRMWGRHNMH